MYLLETVIYVDVYIIYWNLNVCRMCTLLETLTCVKCVHYLLETLMCIECVHYLLETLTCVCVHYLLKTCVENVYIIYWSLIFGLCVEYIHYLMEVHVECECNECFMYCKITPFPPLLTNSSNY